MLKLEGATVVLLEPGEEDVEEDEEEAHESMVDEVHTDEGVSWMHIRKLSERPVLPCSPKGRRS